MPESSNKRAKLSSIFAKFGGRMSNSSEFTADISRFCATARGNCDRFVREFNQELAKRVQENTPVLTGFLRGSWSAAIGSPDISPASGNNRGSVALRLSGVKAGDTVWHTNNAKYGPFVNFGTSRQRGQHFVERTVAQAEEIARMVLARIVKG